jgi:hypothetical protein
VDLPDPLDDHANPAGAAAGDDLLSQLAGDEIDRLLAEGDEPLSSGRKATDLEPDEGSAAGAPAAEAVEVDAPAADAVAEEAVEGPGESAGPSEASSLDAVFSQITAKEQAGDLQEPPNEAGEPAGEVEGPAGEGPVDAAALDASLAGAALAGVKQEDVGDHAGEGVGAAPGTDAPGGEEGETSAAERSALTVEAELAESQALVEGEEAPLPLVLRPLVWLNAPLGFLPEAMRNALGKVALVTLFNALAVLAYVLIFRKH